MPDPLKLVSKLGRRDLVNAQHVEEYRVSCVDLYEVFGNAVINHPLSAALAERYMVPYRDFSSTFATIYNLSKNKEQFHSLFFTLPGDVLWTDPSRPSLDI